MELETFLVERYLPGPALEQLLGSLGRLKVESERLAASGTPVRYLGSLVLAEEETCLCQFEACSREAVEQANRSAHAPYARVVAGKWIPVDTTKRGPR
jgi:hypothetical protein